jgi:hypothetical protein
MTTAVTLTSATIAAFRDDAALIDRCRGLLGAFYRDPDAPLEYAIARESTHVYTAWDGQSLAGVFFARVPEVVQGIEYQLAYMGLTAERRDYSTPRVARALWATFLSDSRDAVGHDTEVVVWYRTGTPFGLYPAQVLLRSGEPDVNGFAPRDSHALISRIRRAYHLPPCDWGSNPFVLRGVATARYNERERAFIAQWRRHRAPDLLCNLGVNEAEGDRLLMIGFLP